MYKYFIKLVFKDGDMNGQDIEIEDSNYHDISEGEWKDRIKIVHKGYDYTNFIMVDVLHHYTLYRESEK